MNELTTTLLQALARTSVWLAVGAIVAFILLRGLRCRSPAVHRTAWCIVLLTGWLLARATVTVPWYNVPPVARRSLPLPTSEIVEAAPSGQPMPSAIGSGPLPPGDVPAALDGPRAPSGTALSWRTVLVAGWLLGGLAIVVWWTIGYVRFVRQLPFGLPLTEEWEAEWREALTEGSVRRPVRLCVAETVGPLVCRTWSSHRLVVPLPLWRELSSQERRAILRHELAHVRRGDLVWSLAARCLALPHWFNPFCWWAVRNFDECGEWACDDAVHRRDSGDAVAYARVLLRFGQADPRPLWGAAIGGKRLSTRIKRMLTGAVPEDSTMKKSLMLGSIGVVALIASVEWRFGARVAGAVDQEVEATHGGLNVDRPVLQRMAEAAAKTYEATQASYDVGTEVMSNVYVWSRRWLEAERALAETDAEELAALRAHRQRMKRLMLIVRALHVTGTKGGEMEKFYATKFYLAEADAWLATAKNRGRDTPTPLKKVAVSFRGPKGMDVRWDENNDGQFDAEPVVCPARHEFLEGGIYFLQFSGFGGIKLKATLEVLAATDEIVSFEIDVGEVKKIAGGERMSKVYFASDQSGVEEVTGWDDLRDSLVAETERHHTVLVVLHISG